MFKTLVKILLNQSNMELPGIFAQQKMSPSVRYTGKGFPEDMGKAQESAVLLLLYPVNDTLNIVLIERSKYKGVHSGQISLPGGKHELSDKSLIETALREASEEIGVITSDVSIIREMTPLFVPASGFIIQPVLSYIMYKPDFIADQTEVNKIIEVNITELFNPLNLRINKISMEGFSISAPCYNINQYQIWGATAMILSELHEILKQAKLSITK